ncbi:hypothetical protein like AT4G29090 [Hibiscus trionum]|uniref:Reverse transcriptase zinc-binding domain-containing protein n=1 Tax=Hibiscus trionum TaxID=183268 RepID=A0A9W7GTU2_HIBTR|nr:hypothetical protein like AT4G29090 [Hibiscus trionum]
MPVAVSTKLNSIMSSFLWGNSQDSSKIHWLKWNQVCKPSNCGGLGVANIVSFNRALLCKWFWHFGNEPEALWRQVVEANQIGKPHNMVPISAENNSSSWI